MGSTPRYTHRPFPSYRHVPGSTPHPLRDPSGHSHGREEPPAPSLQQVPWNRAEAYLYGIDLFNHRYWWECHEALEGLWHATGHKHPLGHALQAIIQCAVAHLKTDQGRTTGAARLLDHAVGHVESAGDAALGFDLNELIIATSAYLSRKGASPALIVLIPDPTR